jgi:hypothetical protein
MTDAEMEIARSNRLLVKVVNHDYQFYGYIVTTFEKWHQFPGKSPWRCVVESPHGVCLIQSAKNLEFMS